MYNVDCWYNFLISIENKFTVLSIFSIIKCDIFTKNFISLIETKFFYTVLYKCRVCLWWLHYKSRNILSRCDVANSVGLPYAIIVVSFSVFFQKKLFILLNFISNTMLKSSFSILLICQINKSTKTNQFKK